MSEAVECVVLIDHRDPEAPRIAIESEYLVDYSRDRIKLTVNRGGYHLLQEVVEFLSHHYGVKESDGQPERGAEASSPEAV